ncbi:helix-turn-helix domain-containing protein [Vagococcus vulneris]|uniref:HTH cro/C1-type domain-containing protein n=1 Tax=Vagococcus vulneris TaxID=1977869 RepID=A0A429ZTX1_9ENTE|nr:helix-turn-helix transcriptional regulator [Vagococcus vulneris]RST97137.1 hypothetical protein CBF37_10170 [Vagococcus vulneris]
MINFNLKHYLKIQKMSLTELAEKTGISRTSLSQLSNGKTQGIQFETLENISLALDIAPGKFFELEIIPPEFKLDFVATYKGEKDFYKIYLIYKTSIKEENFWYGISINSQFVEEEQVKVHVGTLLNSFLFYLIKKKYGYYDGAYQNKVSNNVNRAIRKAEQNMLKHTPTTYFKDSIGFLWSALPFIPNDFLTNKKYITIEEQFFGNFLSESEIKQYNIPNEVIDLNGKVKISNTYLLEDIINQKSNLELSCIETSIQTNIYDDYIDNLELI